MTRTRISYGARKPAFYGICSRQQIVERHTSKSYLCACSKHETGSGVERASKNSMQIYGTAQAIGHCENSMHIYGTARGIGHCENSMHIYGTARGIGHCKNSMHIYGRAQGIGHCENSMHIYGTAQGIGHCENSMHIYGTAQGIGHCKDSMHIYGRPCLSQSSRRAVTLQSLLNVVCIAKIQYILHADLGRESLPHRTYSWTQEFDHPQLWVDRHPLLVAESSCLGSSLLVAGSSSWNSHPLRLQLDRLLEILILCCS